MDALKTELKKGDEIINSA
jgi:chromosome segregation ATPase